MASSLSISIGGTNYQILSFSIKARINERSQFDMVAIDTTNNAVFSKGTKIVVSDTNLGTLFTGFINTAEPQHIIPQPYTYWIINCVDYHYVADKRTVTASYTNQYAGYIALDMLQSTLASEGVTSQFATQLTDTQTDWGNGTLSSLAATGNVEDGDLELIGSSSLSATFNTQAQWNTGTKSNVQANSGGDLSLVQQWRNWNDGVKSNQTLYGNGSPSDSVTSGVYGLSCNALSETRSRLDFASTWAAPFTYVADVYVGGDVPTQSITYLTTSWGNPDNGYAYAVELKTASISLRRGANSASGGSSTQIASHTFSPKLGVGWYTITVGLSGTTHTVSLNGTQYLSVSDATYTAAGNVALRNRNGEPSTSIVMSFDNFGIASSLSGTWTSPSTALTGITTVASSSISWDTTLSTGGTITVQTSIDNGSTYQTATNGGAIPNLPKGTAGSGKTLIIKVSLSTTTPALAPDIRNLQWNVLGGYTSPGTRSTAPLGNDTMVRANQSGWGTSFDGQTYTKVGTGTDAIATNEATIANTTGNCHEHLGSTTGTDEDGTVNFQFSANTINGAIELRFTDANNFYQLVCSTTAISIAKMLAGTQTTLATAAVALSTNTFYTMRFRVVGAAPAVLQGRVWAKGTLEPSVWAVTASDSGTSSIALTLYGSNAPSATLPGAGKLSSGTGGTDTQSANNVPASSTTGYMELSPLGGTQTINAALPAAPSGHGWLWDVTTLEGQTINTGVWQLNVGIADTGLFGDTNVTLVWRIWKRLSAGTYSSVGNVTLTGQTVNTTRTNFILTSGSLSSMGFVTGDKAYFELYAGNISWSTGFGGQTYAVWVSSSGTAGVNNDAMATTPGYQSSGSGNIASGGFALMANGTGTTSFDHLRVTQYPDPAMSLATVGRVGSTFITWNALTPTNTTLGMDLSPDGVNWTDVSVQNGGSIPFINSLQPPVLDYFNVNTSANYQSTNRTGGAVATVTFDTTNSRLTLTGGTNAIYLNAAITWADVDLLCDLDQADAGGLVWRFVDASDFYLLTIADASSNVGTPNLLALYKVSSNVATQLALAPITFPRGTYHRFRVTMLAGVITAQMDGTTLISYTDSSPLAAGQVGLFQNGGAVGSRYYTFWTQPQGDYVGGTPFGDIVSAQFVYSRQRLATTDSTVTPQVLDMTIGVTDPYIGLGTLLPQTSYATAYISSNMDDLTNKSANYAWQIDQNGKLRFQVIQATPAPWVLDSRDSMVQKLRVINEAPGYSNRQQLTGVVSTISFTESQVGDGTKRAFAMPFPLASAPTITLNTNPQSVGIKGIDSNKNWYWQYNDPNVYQDANGTVLTSSNTVAVTGMGLTTTTVTRDALSAQATMQAAEQTGTGIVEAVTDVSQFGMNVAAAQVYGDQLNTRYANLGRTFKFETTRFGLAPGQLIPGFVGSRGITNAQLFITSVETQARAYSTARSGQIARVFGSTLQASRSHGAVGVRYISLIEASETAYTGSWARKLATKRK